MAGTPRSASLWRMLVVVGAAVLAAGALFAWSSALFPLLAGFLLAYLTDPLASYFERHHMPRILGFLVILLMFAAVLVVIFALFLPALVNELVVVAEKLPSWQEVMQERITPLLADVKARFPGSYALLEGRLTSWLHVTIPNMADRMVNRLIGQPRISPGRCQRAPQPGPDPRDCGLPYGRLQPLHRLASAAGSETGAARGPARGGRHP